jgi:Uma2 family endonuclease
LDNELQILIPNLLLAILALIWQKRDDWFFGINMGIYYAPNQSAIVPDGFLSLGVERFVGENGRYCYVLWEEDGIPPILALEVVSQTYNGEYEQKKNRLFPVGHFILCHLCSNTFGAKATTFRSLSFS